MGRINTQGNAIECGSEKTENQAGKRTASCNESTGPSTERGRDGRTTFDFFFFTFPPFFFFREDKFDIGAVLWVERERSVEEEEVRGGGGYMGLRDTDEDKDFRFETSEKRSAKRLPNRSDIHRQ